MGGDDAPGVALAGDDGHGGGDMHMAMAMGKGGATLCKVSKPHQDMRFDVPVLGPDTIRNAAEAGVDAIGIEAGKTLILAKEEVIALCQTLKVSLVAV